MWPTYEASAPLSRVRLSRAPLKAPSCFLDRLPSHVGKRRGLIPSNTAAERNLGSCYCSGLYGSVLYCASHHGPQSELAYSTPWSSQAEGGNVSCVVSSLSDAFIRRSCMTRRLDSESNSVSRVAYAHAYANDWRILCYVTCNVCTVYVVHDDCTTI